MNDTNSIQSQINTINQKLDVLLEYHQQQRLKSAMIDDLAADLSLIGKDIYNTAVTELDNYSVELDPDQIKLLAIKLLKNIPTFIGLIDLLESANDLVKDAGPMVNELLIDFTKKLQDYEERGYVDLFRNLAHPSIINGINTALTTVSNLEKEKLPEYSWWRLLKEMKSPEVRKTLTFMIIMLKSYQKNKP